MEKIYKIKITNLIYYFSLPIILILLLASFFILPSADDFVYASRLFDQTYWATQVSEYLTWNGRYTATAILTGSPLAWGRPGFYFLHSMTLILILIFSTYYLLNQFNSVDQKWKLSVSFIALFFLQMYSLNEGLYWLSGAWTYTFPLVLTNLLIATLIKHFRYDKNYLSAFLLIFLIIGCNETTMVMSIVLLFAITTFIYIEERKLNKYLMLLTAFAVLCGLVVVLAPGNFIRASHFEKSHQVTRTLIYPIKHTIGYLFIFFNIPFIILMLCNSKKFYGVVSENYHKYFYFMVPLIIYVAALPSYWGMGVGPNYRTRISIQWLCWIISFLLIPIIYTNSAKMQKLINKISPKLTLILLIIGVLISKNFLNLSKDVIKAFPYSDIRRANYSNLNNSTTDNIKVNYLNPELIPATFIFKDFQLNLVALRKYYKNKKIELQK